MKPQVLALYYVDFDLLENKTNMAIRRQRLVVAVDEPNGKPAHAIIQETLAKEPPKQPYLGWDLQVYPKYEVEILQ